MRRRPLLAALGATSVAACDAPSRLLPPTQSSVRAPFLGLPDDCRFVLDGTDDDVMGRVAGKALVRELDHAQRTNRPLGAATFLAISGGGENGAYGAGLLVGWSQAGTRPEFKVVTGVSTGALSAPFAFLGPAYDRQLTQVYTEIAESDVMTSRGLLTTLFSDSAYDSAPLLRMIRGFITPDFLAAIAREYTEKGRLLMVATTNLDVPVGVLWNMGAIAASGHPRAAELFAHVLLASASIPGAFPPVMIDIDAGEGRFQEMHVDGGTVAQVVLYPPSFGGADSLELRAKADPKLLRTILERKRRLYLIRNSRPGADPQTVSRNTLKIAGRAVSTLIQTQGIGDLYQLYVIAQRDGIDYNVTSIPESFTDKPKAAFEQAYMRKLYELGRQRAATASVWSKYPPGFDPKPINRAEAGTADWKQG